MTNYQICFALRALWFVLEIIMAKNENNSHAFIRKMVENIKQTKDAQAPTDPKTNEVIGIVTLHLMGEVCMYALKCCSAFLFFAETLHGVWRRHAHHHVEEHHLQSGIPQRPGSSVTLLHQTWQGWFIEASILIGFFRACFTCVEILALHLRVVYNCSFFFVSRISTTRKITCHQRWSHSSPLERFVSLCVLRLMQVVLGETC